MQRAILISFRSSASSAVAVRGQGGTGGGSSGNGGGSSSNGGGTSGNGGGTGRMAAAAAAAARGNTAAAAAAGGGDGHGGGSGSTGGGSSGNCSTTITVNDATTNLAIYSDECVTIVGAVVIAASTPFMSTGSARLRRATP